MSIKLKDKAIIDSDKLDGKDSSQFSLSSHTHSGYASSTHSHDQITFQDTRGANPVPRDVATGIGYHLKNNSADGLNDGHSLHGVLNLKQWNDITGGAFHQLGFTNNGNIYSRYSTNETTWSGWNKLATMADINRASNSSMMYQPSNNVRITFPNPSSGGDAASYGRVLGSFTAKYDGILKVRATINNKVGHVRGEILLFTLCDSNDATRDVSVITGSQSFLFSAPANSLVLSRDQTCNFKPALISSTGSTNATYEACFKVEKCQRMVFVAGSIYTGESIITNVQLLYDEVAI